MIIEINFTGQTMNWKGCKKDISFGFWRRSQESHLVVNHVEFIDYFTMRFTDMPPIMPPHVFP